MKLQLDDIEGNLDHHAKYVKEVSKVETWNDEDFKE